MWADCYNKISLDSENKKQNNLVKLENYLEQKQFELKIDNNPYDRGIVKGVKIALAILKNEGEVK